MMMMIMMNSKVMKNVMCWLSSYVTDYYFHSLAYWADATVKPSSESKNLYYYLVSTYVLEEMEWGAC